MQIIQSLQADANLISSKHIFPSQGHDSIAIGIFLLCRIMGPFETSRATLALSMWYSQICITRLIGTTKAWWKRDKAGERQAVHVPIY